MKELIFSPTMDVSEIEMILDDSEGKKILLARQGQTVEMSLMVSGYMRMCRWNKYTSRTQRHHEMVNAYVTISNIEYELAEGDVIRIFEDRENYDVFMMVVGNQGRLSVTETRGADVKDLL